MPVNLSRQELYDLVWSKPMMHAAKDFSISGVMLGRICRERNVPCPPRGYWAKLSSKNVRKRPEKLPLPNLPVVKIGKDFDSRLKEEYRQREEARTDKFDPYDLNDPIKDPPKEFTESMEDFELRVAKSMPKLIDPLRIAVRHPIVQKMLDADLLVAAACKRKDYCWDKPKYQDEKGQTELQMLNGVIHNFEAFGFTVNLRGRKNFRLSVSLLGCYKEFAVFIDLNEPDYYFRIGRTKEKKGKKYCFRWENSYDSRGRPTSGYRFDQFDKGAIKQIVMDLVLQDEREYRTEVFRSYESAVESRKRAIQANAQRIREEAERKRKALEALLASRVNLMETAVKSINQADKIRELTVVMLDKARAHGKSIGKLEHWASWAKHYADTIDPRHMSLDSFESWIMKFRLKD